MAKKKQWKETELMLAFSLEKIAEYKTPLMEEWLNVSLPEFDIFEQHTFDDIYSLGVRNMLTWGEEDLKMKFLSIIVKLGNMTDEGNIVTFFDKPLKGIVNDISLSVKSDFMMAKGFMDLYQTPYFHFQEYKPQINPTGEPMAQLLEAFLIAQEKNKEDNFNFPLYGCEIIGGSWRFVIMENEKYCVSKVYDSVNREELLQIIAILRKYKVLLKERYMTPEPMVLKLDR
jgi:hypothetical protein